MKALSGGERAVRCLLGEPIDRVPFGVGLGWYPWGEALERWCRESGNPSLAYSVELGYDPSFALPAMYPGIFPHFEPVVIEESDEFIIARNEHGITMRNRRDGGSMPEFLDYPVKTPEDWDRLKEERLQIDHPGRNVQDWNAFRAYIKETGIAVQVGSFPFGVFGTVRDFMGAEEVLVAFYSYPEMLHDMMNHLTSLWISLWEKVSAEIQIDHIHIWEDMAGRQGSLISPAMIREFMMPCYDRIVDFAKSAGVRIVSVDSDGDCSELVPIMMEHGINMFLPFEVQAGCDMLEYRRLYPKLGIIGGLDKRILAKTKSDIDAEVDRCEQMLKFGRYIPSFDHLIPPDVPWENFKYASEKIKKVCYSLGNNNV